jgi:hypothetical protein
VHLAERVGFEITLWLGLWPEQDCFLCWRKVEEMPSNKFEKSAKHLKPLALPRGIEPLFQP